MRRVALVLAVWASAAMAEPRPVSEADYPPVAPELAQLGQWLFWDPILSGNRNIACGTCHHPSYATSDGVSLSLGEGATGLGPARTGARRLARNTPALFNLGAREFTTLFHDGRVEAGTDGLRTPLPPEVTAQFGSALAVQVLFPVLSADEMAGQPGTNPVAQAARDGRIAGPDGAMALVAARVRAIPAYRKGFAALERQTDFPDIAQAIAAFIASEWRSDQSPFDAYLRGEAPLPPAAETGRRLFYGKAGCAACHAGPFQTDHRFHAMGAPQIGPGLPEGLATHARDPGRFRVDGQSHFAFRTPSLRNVTQTGPYGHAGGHRTLRGFLVDHLDPVSALERFQLDRSVWAGPSAPEDLGAMAIRADRDALAKAVTRPPLRLSEGEISALLAFLEALEDPTALAGRRGIPTSVPSGLPVPRP